MIRTSDPSCSARRYQPPKNRAAVLATRFHRMRVATRELLNEGSEVADALCRTVKTVTNLLKYGLEVR